MIRMLTCIFIIDSKETIAEKLDKATDVFINNYLDLNKVEKTNDWEYNKDLVRKHLYYTLFY